VSESTSQDPRSGFLGNGSDPPLDEDAVDIDALVAAVFVGQDGVTDEDLAVIDEWRHMTRTREAILELVVEGRVLLRVRDGSVSFRAATDPESELMMKMRSDWSASPERLR